MPPHMTVARLMDRFPVLQSKQQPAGRRWAICTTRIGRDRAAAGPDRILLKEAPMGSAFSESRQTRHTTGTAFANPLVVPLLSPRRLMPAAPATRVLLLELRCSHAYWGKVSSDERLQRPFRASTAKAGPASSQALRSLGWRPNCFHQRAFTADLIKRSTRPPSHTGWLPQRAPVQPSGNAATGTVAHRLRSGGLDSTTIPTVEANHHRGGTPAQPQRQGQALTAPRTGIPMEAGGSGGAGSWFARR